MHVTETTSAGLKREFRITVPAGELEEKVARRLDEIGRQVRLPGFRPGKIPAKILRQRFGASVLGEVLENTVEGATAETMRERNLRPALPPKVDIVSFSEGADLEYDMSVELMPEIPEIAFADLGLERLAVEVPQAEIDKAIERLAEQQRKSEPVERPAESGDILLVDMAGTVEGKEFPGGTGTDRRIALGGGNFLPGFEDQLVGAAAGEHRTVRVTFPEDSAATDLAGKQAIFEIDVKEVHQRLPAAIDDTLAEAVGLETLDELRQEVRQQLQQEFDQAARQRLKQALLDKLAAACDFPLPAGMVDLEFERIWQQYQAMKEQQAGAAGTPPGEVAEGGAAGAAAEEAGTAPPAEPAAGESAEAEAAGESAEAPSAEAAAPAGGAPSDGENVDEETVKGQYRAIAERRVRLGLLLAEVGRNNNITVSQEELNQALIREARRHPGHERQIVEFYRQNPAAMNELRAPIFEDKVIDFIVEMAKLGVRTVTPEELMALPEPGGEAEAPS